MEDFDEEDTGKKTFVVKKNIAEIAPNDTLIQVIGKAKNINPSMEFHLFDDTGSFPVREIPTEVEKIVENVLYRVMGEITIDGSGTQFLQAHIIHVMSGLNVENYKKSIELLRKIE